MSKITFLSLMLTLLLGAQLHAQRHRTIGMAYWDVDRLYDTIPSMFYDDSNFTPKGRYRWDSRRYNQKIERVAAVIDSMHLPLVALYGVESEDVVRDIVVATKGDYSYIHRTIEGRDGLDFALLYFGDRLFIDYVKTLYGRIYIEGEIDSVRIGIWLTRSGSLQRSAQPPHRDSVDLMVVAGSLSHSDLEKIGVKDHTPDYQKIVRGNALSHNGWYMRHRIGTLQDVRVIQSGVYLKRWLLRSDKRIPFATLSDGYYYGGYSSYLPIFLIFSLEHSQVID